MRTKQMVKGLRNSQKIRVIVDGVGFYTTVGGVDNICTTEHRVAILMGLDQIAKNGIVGFGGQMRHYDSQLKAGVVNYQVDLV